MKVDIKKGRKLVQNGRKATHAFFSEEMAASFVVDKYGP